MENVGNKSLTEKHLVFITISTKEEVRCELNNFELSHLLDAIENPSEEGNLFHASNEIALNVSHIVKVFVTK